MGRRPNDIIILLRVQPDNPGQNGMSLNDLCDMLDSIIIDNVSMEGWKIRTIKICREDGKNG